MVTATSTSTSTSTSASTSLYLDAAAKGGMFVKLHVNDGCDTAVDIPVKNLLTVNPSKETLSDTASYSILRHCALSELFRYAPNRHIPNYAWKNFITQFTYYDYDQQEHEGEHDPFHHQLQLQPGHQPSPSPSQLTIIKLIIANNAELTHALNGAASKRLMDDNDNIILHIHCQFLNQFHYNYNKEVSKLRQEATVAADHVVKTLKIWVQRASQFVNNHTKNIGSEDFVLVMANEGGRQHLNDNDSHISDNHNDIHNHTQTKQKQTNSAHPARGRGRGGMEWTARFVQALLIPETIHGGTTSTRSTSKSTHIGSGSGSVFSPSSSSHHAKNMGDAEAKAETTTEQFDQYEESIDVLADSLVKGFRAVSNFITTHVIEKLQETNNHHHSPKSMKDTNDDEVLSLSPSPSLAESASLLSNDDYDDDEIDDNSTTQTAKEEGVEIVFGDANNCECEEWKIFFGDSHDVEENSHDDDDELTLVDSPCDADIISLSSSFGESFKAKVEMKEGDDDNSFCDSDVSWAMLSDDE